MHDSARHRQKSFQEYREYYTLYTRPQTVNFQLEVPGNRFYREEKVDNSHLPPGYNLFYLSDKFFCWYTNYTDLGWGANCGQYLKKIKINA